MLTFERSELPLRLNLSTTSTGGGSLWGRAQQSCHQGGELRDKIQIQELTLRELKEKRRQTPVKLTLKELPETERFAQLKTEKKHFIDTIKLIAYRAESASAGEIREALAREDDGRALLRRLFVTPANLRPRPRVAQILTIEMGPA
jgi:hypothetical protein